MSSSSIRIISSSSTTRIRLAGGADCNGVADVILYPPMDAPVTPCCATDAWDVAHAAYSPLKPSACSKIPLASKQWSSPRRSLGLLPQPCQQAVKAKLRHVTLRPMDSSTEAAQLRRFDSRHHGPDT